MRHVSCVPTLNEPNKVNVTIFDSQASSFTDDGYFCITVF